MKRVYIAQSPQEAHLIRGFLASQGIEAVVQGEHMQWLLGDIPLADTYPWVCVSEDDYERAKELIAGTSTLDQPSSDSSAINLRD